MGVAGGLYGNGRSREEYFLIWFCFLVCGLEVSRLWLRWHLKAVSDFV